MHTSVEKVGNMSLSQNKNHIKFEHEKVMKLLPPELYDGWAIHAQALSCGLRTTLLPNQVLITNPPDKAGSRACFVKGVPPSTLLAGATFGMSRSVWRKALAIENLPIVEGRSFPLSHKLRSHLYAARLGYPVRVRSARSGEANDQDLVANSPLSLHRILRSLEIIPEDYSKSNSLDRPGYAYTGFNRYNKLDGKTVGLSGTNRVLIENFLRHNVIHLLVIDGRVHSHGWEGLAHIESKPIPVAALEIAEKAFGVIEGLNTGSIEVYYCEKDGSAVIRNFSERLNLHLLPQESVENLPFFGARKAPPFSIFEMNIDTHADPQVFAPAARALADKCGVNILQDISQVGHSICIQIRAEAKNIGLFAELVIMSVFLKASKMSISPLSTENN